MRWPCGAHGMRVCGAVEVAAVTMIAPESRKSALAGLKICAAHRVDEGVHRQRRRRAVVRAVAAGLDDDDAQGGGQADRVELGVERFDRAEQRGAVDRHLRLEEQHAAECQAAPSAAMMASTRVLPLYETTSTSATLGTMPTQPTVLSTAQSSPSTAVPCARELSSSVPCSSAAPWAVRSSWLKRPAALEIDHLLAGAVAAGEAPGVLRVDAVG